VSRPSFGALTPAGAAFLVVLLGYSLQLTNLYWKYQTAPGRTGGTAETAGVTFETPAGA
jgi:hypothetical protein